LVADRDRFDDTDTRAGRSGFASRTTFAARFGVREVRFVVFASRMAGQRSPLMHTSASIFPTRLRLDTRRSSDPGRAWERDFIVWNAAHRAKGSFGCQSFPAIFLTIAGPPAGC
jgi:hypothetical protein